MSLDKAMVAKIARLAQIKLPEDALEPMAKELSHILTFVEQLSAVPTTDVLPMTSVEQMSLRLRADQVTDGAQAARVLSNAPETLDGFYVVPKVIE